MESVNYFRTISQRFIQHECNNHEYIEEKLASSGTSFIKIYWQCRFCGKYLNDNEPESDTIISIPNE